MHLGQSGLSTTDIKTWLMKHEDLAGLATDAMSLPVTPMFITPAEMIDVAETELLSNKNTGVSAVLPGGENASIMQNEANAMPVELDAWLTRLTSIATASDASTKIQDTLLPAASFAVASYRASLLPLLGDENESTLQGGTGTMARLPLEFTPSDAMIKLKDPHVAAMSIAALTPKTESQPDTPHD